MQRLLYICLMLLIIQFNLLAQQDDVSLDDEKIDSNSVLSTDSIILKKKNKSSFFKLDKTFIGSNFSVEIGNFLYVDISPYAGYRLGNMLGVGAGLTYIYTAQLTTGGIVNEQNIYGGRLFTNFMPFPENSTILKGAYLHLEGEMLNRQIATYTRLKYQREWIPAVNVGVGFNSNFVKGFSFTMEFVYNALWISQLQKGITPVFSSPFQYRLGIYYAF